jgi:hypothetical protein
MVERRPLKPLVVGSIPTWTTTQKHKNTKTMFGFFKKVKDKLVSKEPKFHIRTVSELSPEEKEKLKAQYQVLEERLNKSYNEESEFYKKRASEKNGVCPKCKSENVNNRIKRIKGEISGSSYGSSVFGTGSSRGSLSGSVDTHEVNKCNDCQHEWQIYDYKPTWVSIYDVIDYPTNVMRFMEKAYNGNVEWNPNDLNETCASKEEKIQGEIKSTINGFYGKRTKELFGDLSLELLQYIVDVDLHKYETLHSYEIKKWNEANKKILHEQFGIKFLHEM